MQKYKRLFIDKVTNDFNPDVDYVLGPWCLDGLFSYNRIKEFYNKGIILEDKSIDQIKAFKCCEDQHSRLISKIANYVKTINENKYSLNFYEDYVSNWFSLLIHVMHYSSRLLNEYLKKFSDEYVELVLFYEPRKIIFKNTKEFSFKCVRKHNFFSNLTLFLLLKNKPEKWKVTYCNFPLKINNNEKKSLYERIAIQLGKYLSPRVRLVYGLNIFEKTLISLVLSLKRPVIKYQTRKKYYSTINQTYENPPVSDKYIFELAKELLPQSFKEIYKKKEKFSNCEGKIILCSAASYLVDDDEKFDLLVFREKKGSIFSVQHGANYGDIYLQRGSMEYGADKFISWGQKKLPNFDINFDPLPSPQLRMSYKKNNSEKILFVSTTNCYVYPRYVSSQSFDDSVQRINNTISFLSNLGDKYINNINYREHNFGFSERSLLEKKFNLLNFINSSAEKNLNKSRLIVLNNYSTFLYKCLAANAPTIIFFKRNCWKVHDKALRLYDGLNKAGILFYDPILAAEKVKTIWPNVMQWWNKDEVQLARKNFCDEYANKSNKWLLTWIKFILNQS